LQAGLRVTDDADAYLWLTALGFQTRTQVGNTLTGCTIFRELEVRYFGFVNPPWTPPEAINYPDSFVVLFSKSALFTGGDGQVNQGRLTDAFEEATNEFLVEWLKANQ